MKRYIQQTLGLIVMLLALPAHAGDDGRCGFMPNNGVIPYDVAQASNHWGVVCGKITAADAATLDAAHRYAIYAGAGGTFLISPAPGAGTPCNVYTWLMAADIRVVGYCTAGCYPPDQELEFGGDVMSIESAFRNDVKSVTALANLSLTGEMSFAEQTIESFVSGYTQESLFTLMGDGGERLVVTSEHPMVTADGALMPARELRAGDALLGANGQLIELAAIVERPYSGWVWNVRPVSNKKSENILVAQGFLTGSVRFQNEWANDDFRLSQRDSLDVDKL